MKHRDDLVKYFKVFSDKNIDTLSEMFSDDVELNSSGITKDTIVNFLYE